MKILFITNNFTLPHQPGMPRPWKVAQHLASLGHCVTVITNKRHYLDENISIGGDGNKHRVIVDAVEIIGVETTSGRRKNLIRRFINYFSFTFNAFKLALTRRKQDIVIVGTPPAIFPPMIGIILGFLWKAYTILEIRDLYPETAFALGKVKNPLIYYLWNQLENHIRCQYNHIVAVVPRIYSMLREKGIRPSKMTIITNGFDIEHTNRTDIPDDLEYFFSKNTNKCIFIYGGGMGYAMKVMTIIKAAEYCKNDPNIIFALFGEGEMKSIYMNYIQEKKLANCFIFPAQPRMVINEIFRRANALVHSMPDVPLFDYTLPNKIFEYHGAGRPIIYAGRGDAAVLINKAGSGLTVEPENYKEMAKAAKYIADHKKEAEKMGVCGKAYILRHFNRDKIFTKWTMVINAAHQNT